MISAASAIPTASTGWASSASQTPVGTVGGAGQTLNQNDFLRLLTAQLEHQDPLNPMTGDQFAVELAQFSTATGVENLEKSLGSQAAVGLVGHYVSVAGNALVLGQSGAATGAFSLSDAASNVAVTITDAGGRTVSSMNLGPMAAGNQTFSWNGASLNGARLASGTYSFSVRAAGADGAAVSATPYAVVPVTAVALGGQNGPLLDLGGGLAPVAVSAVQQVF
jgi:flagellar basal-body rod modification protein FlgD